MAITLSSSSTSLHSVIQENEQRYRLDKIDECRHLLQGLKEGTYYIKWEGIFPVTTKATRPNNNNTIDIKIESKLEYGKYIHPRKPYVTKKIKICGKDSSCIKSWNTEQIEELVIKIASL